MTWDGRTIVGVLKGFDQNINLILSESKIGLILNIKFFLSILNSTFSFTESHERVYSTGAGIEKVPLGLYGTGMKKLVILNFAVFCIFHTCVGDSR